MGRPLDALCVCDALRLIALVAAIALHSFDLEGFVFVIAVAVAVWIGGARSRRSSPSCCPSWLSTSSHRADLHRRDAAYGRYFVVFSVLALLITIVDRGPASRRAIAARRAPRARSEGRATHRGPATTKQDLLDLRAEVGAGNGVRLVSSEGDQRWSPEQEALYDSRRRLRREVSHLEEARPSRRLAGSSSRR
jgi:hypothetical protein